MAIGLESRASAPQTALRAAVRVREVSLAYPSRNGASVQALADVSLHARDGELLAVVGPSGCGKSSLLEILCGLRAPDSGTVAVPPAVLMPQADLLLPWLDALDNAALALRIAGVKRERAQAAKELEQRRLAAAARSHDREQLAQLGAQRDLRERL